jgi:hypothetical protein
MNESVDCSSVHYAVIEAIRIQGPPEPIVIGYRDEETLRDLIAAPSIIGVGFASRQQAVASTEVASLAALASTRSARRTVVQAAEKPEYRFHFAEWRFRDAFVLWQARKIGRRILHEAAAAAIRMFYSRNDISVAIRFALGSYI